MVEISYDLIKSTLYDSSKYDIEQKAWKLSFKTGKLEFQYLDGTSSSYKIFIDNNKLYFKDEKTELNNKLSTFDIDKGLDYFALIFKNDSNAEYTFKFYANNSNTIEGTGITDSIKFKFLDCTYIRSKTELDSLRFTITYSKLLMGLPITNDYVEVKSDYYCKYLLERMFLENNSKDVFDRNKLYRSRLIDSFEDVTINFNELDKNIILCENGKYVDSPGILYIYFENKSVNGKVIYDLILAFCCDDYVSYYKKLEGTTDYSDLTISNGKLSITFNLTENVKDCFLFFYRMINGTDNVELKSASPTLEFNYDIVGWFDTVKYDKTTFDKSKNNYPTAKSLMNEWNIEFPSIKYMNEDEIKNDCKYGNCWTLNCWTPPPSDFLTATEDYIKPYTFILLKIEVVENDHDETGEYMIVIIFFKPKNKCDIKVYKSIDVNSNSCTLQYVENYSSLNVDYSIEKNVSYTDHEIKGGISFDKRNLILYYYDTLDHLRLCSKLSKGVSDKLLSPFYSFKSIDKSEGSDRNVITLSFEDGDVTSRITYQGYSITYLMAFVVKEYTEPPKVITNISFYSNYQMNSKDVILDKMESFLDYYHFTKLTTDTFDTLKGIVTNENSIELVVNYTIGDKTFVDLHELTFDFGNIKINFFYNSTWRHINYTTPNDSKVDIKAISTILLDTSSIEFRLNYSVKFESDSYTLTIIVDNDYNHYQKGDKIEMKSIYFKVASGNT